MNIDPVVILGLVAALALVTVVTVITLEQRRVRSKGEPSRRRDDASSVAALSVASSAGSSAGADCGAAGGSGSCS